MKKNILILASLMMTGSLFAQVNPGSELAYKVKREAYNNSNMEDYAQFTTDFLGSRLAGSKQMTRSEKLVAEKLEQMGLQNVKIEKAADFSKGGWDNVKTYAAMTSPYYCNFFGISKGWTGSTNGQVDSDVVLLEIENEEDIKKYEGKLKDKIVLYPSNFSYRLDMEPLAKRYTDEELENLKTDPRSIARPARSYNYRGASELQNKINELIQSERPAVLISERGVFNIPMVGSGRYVQGAQEPIAELILPAEAHGRMYRMIKKGIPVSMAVDIKNEFSENNAINNVIAEIKGTDPKLKDEVVLIGAHLDSWYGGTGAADNSSGVAVMMEAMRIIKALGINPKRTIRIALWGGEEQGMIGSRGYSNKYLYDRNAKKKLKDYNNFALYLNMDNGSGRYKGIYLEENDMAVPFFETWMKQFESLGFTTVTLAKTGGTDHQVFQGIGLPAFQFIQDDLDYDRTYHTPMDTYERLCIQDLKTNAAMTAWFAICAAMDPNKISCEDF